MTVVAVDGAPPNAEQGPNEVRGRLPFPSASFALVASRHESFIATEVGRVLTPGGVFVSEQLGGDYGDFYAALELGRPGQAAWDLRVALQQLSAAGLRPLRHGEAREVTTFADVGAFAWYLRAVPWAVEGFSIATHRAELGRLHERMQSGDVLRVALPAFWFVARRPT